MKRLCRDPGASRIKSAGCLAVALIGLGSIAFADLAAAAGANRRETARIERRVMTRTSPAGPVVLRGTPPANSNANQPAPAVTQGYGASSAPAGVLQPGAGVDTSLDRSGLSPPGGFLMGR
jgi:hypothetical protein